MHTKKTHLNSSGAQMSQCIERPTDKIVSKYRLLCLILTLNFETFRNSSWHVPFSSDNIAELNFSFGLSLVLIR